MPGVDQRRAAIGEMFGRQVVPKVCGDEHVDTGACRVREQAVACPAAHGHAAHSSIRGTKAADATRRRRELSRDPGSELLQTALGLEHSDAPKTGLGRC
jgi:hypothetical protein